ncbi:hypothetical protein BVY01_05270 [bacterium I07]|nr:hypothetical protein BVY01_05270 [bacterium I07]
MKNFEDLEDLLKRARVHHDPAFQSAYEIAQFRPRVAKELRKMALSYIEDPDQEPFPFEYLINELSDGIIFVGNTWDEKFAINAIRRELIHFNGNGASNIGKSTVGRLLANEIRKQGDTIWIFEVLKRESRGLLRLWPDLIVLPIQKLRINLLEPPENFPPKQWAEIFSRDFSVITGLMGTSEGDVFRYVDGLYEIFDVYNGSQTYPCILDLRDYVLFKEPKRGTLEYQRWERICNRLDKQCRSLGDTVLNCSRGMPLQQLENRCIVFEAQGILPDVAQLLFTVLTKKVIYRRYGQSG